MSKESKAAEYANRYAERDWQIVAKDAYLDGWNDALRSQWISVEERLPELKQRVLVAYKLNTKISYCIMKRIPHDTTNPSNQKWHWSITNYKEDVIAWMPIPSLYDLLETNK